MLGGTDPGISGLINGGLSGKSFEDGKTGPEAAGMEIGALLSGAFC